MKVWRGARVAEMMLGGQRKADMVPSEKLRTRRVGLTLRARQVMDMWTMRLRHTWLRP